MSDVRAVEESILLELLDFSVPCVYPDDVAPADVAMVCRGCGFAIFLCNDHAARIRQRWRMVELFGQGRSLKRNCCGLVTATLDEQVWFDRLRGGGAR